MTTTHIYQGVDEKNSSRVLRPPGGGSSDIFGTGSEKPSAAQEQKQNAQRSQGGSNIFGGPVNDDDQPGVKHINRKQQPSSQSAIFGDSPSASDLKKRNQEEYHTNKSLTETKTKREEFPTYDRSVYMAQMAPQRRNIQQVSTYNPITNESYAGFEYENQEQQTSPAKRRGQNVNQVASFNVITNQCSDDQGYAEPSPLKPGKRSLSNSEEGTYNPITGQAIGGKGDEQPKNSSRVLKPPGGQSQGLW